MAAFGEQAPEVGRRFRPAPGGPADAEAWSEPAPERGRDQQLAAPSENTAPGRRLGPAAEPVADGRRALATDRVAAQRFDDHGGGVPTVRIQPVRQQAHRVTADCAQEATHPDQDPDAFRDSTHLTRVAAVANELKDPIGITGRFAATDAESRAERVDGWRIGTAGAELLDGDGEAVYNDHRFGGGGGESRVSAKRRASPLPPFLPNESPSYSSIREILK